MKYFWGNLLNVSYNFITNNIVPIGKRGTTWLETVYNLIVPIP